MFFRLLLESFRRQRRRKLLAGIAVFLGTTAITAMLALATTIGDRIHRELAVYGANIIMTPQAADLSVSIGGVDLHPATANAYLHESDLAKLRTIFWANNITGISPERHQDGRLAPIDYAAEAKTLWLPASAPGELPSSVPATLVGYWFNHPFGSGVTGAPALHPWWKMEGHWPSERGAETLANSVTEEVVVGEKLARRFNLHIGDNIVLREEHLGKIVGVISTGDRTDNEILYALDAVRMPKTHVAGEPTTYAPIDLDRVEVSARTRPEDAFARKDPDTLSPKQRDLWYCRPYANSIAFQIHEAIPSARVTELRQVEQTEGTILSRISGLLWLIAAAAMLAAAFAVSAAMATAILERRAEIGLMRSLGASRAAVATLFYVESAALALFAGALGYLAGSVLSAFLGARIFNAPALGAPTHIATLNPVLLPIVLGLALLIALAGSTPPIRSALRLDPSATLRADA